MQTNHPGTKFPSTLTLSLLLILGTAIILSCYLTVNKATAYTSPPKMALADDGTDHYLYYAVYTVSDGQTSTLALNNSMNLTQNARVTLYNKQGEALVVPDITLAAHQNLYFNVADWIAESGRADFEEGSLELFFHGSAMGIGGQLVVTDENHGLNFDVPFVEDAMFASRRLESLWWSLDSQSTAKIYLANIKTERMTVTPTFYIDGQARESEPIILEAHESTALNIRQALRALNVVSAPVRGGITVKHDRQIGSLAVAGAITNRLRGFSTTLRFIDMKAQHSTRLHGAHILAGKPEAQAGFAPGTSFVPRLTVSNITQRPVTVKPTVLYTTASDSRTLKIAPVTLAAHEVREISLNPVLASVGTKRLRDASVEIEHTDRPGAIVAAIASVDQSRSQVIDTPLRDPRSTLTGGSYPFRIDGDNRAVIHLKNIDPVTSEKMRVCEVHLMFDGLAYTLPAQMVEVGQTLAIDIRKLRDEQVPDGSGKLIPMDATKGQVAWFNWGARGMFVGRLVQYNPVRGTASSFSCPQPCFCDEDVDTTDTNNTYIEPTSYNGFPGEDYELSAWERRVHCSNVDRVRIDGVTFKSSNNAIVSIDGTTATLGIGAGAAKITASWTTSMYEGTTGGCAVEFAPGILPPECEPVECVYLPKFNGASGESPVKNMKIDITLGGTRITDTTRNVIVGQEISLATQVTPATVVIAAERWAVPGNRIAGYAATIDPANRNNTSGRVTPLTNLTNNTIQFYWVDGGDGRQVTYSGTANGRAFTRRVTYNVKRPAARIFAETLSEVEVSALDDGNLYLHFGDRTGAPGIRFEKRVTMPNGFTGDTQWVQLVTTMRTRRTNANVLMTLQGAGLDTSYPYPPVPGAPLFAADSPGQQLFPTYTTQTVSDTFTIWLMFKPTGTAGTPIWVPLRKVNWDWRGNASRTADPNNPNNWGLNTAGWQPDPPDTDATDHPLWTTNITSYGYR